MNFKDGLINLINGLANKRSAKAANYFTDERVTDDELKAIFNTGIGKRIVRIKSSYALKDSLIFESKAQEEYYKRNLAKKVKQAAEYMCAFGRGIVVIREKGDDLSEPMKDDFSIQEIEFLVFDGATVSPINTSVNLNDERFYKPQFYNVRGVNVHYSRVIDFTYYEPVLDDKPNYKYGGISEYNIIYEQLVSDSVISRASSSIVERSSTLFYKVDGFKNLLRNNQESGVLDYFSSIETMRGIYGAGIIDKDDSVETHAQSLSNLKETDEIALSRLAMVTGIPYAVFIGQGAKGLNATTSTEKDLFNEMIDVFRYDFLLNPINELMNKLGFNEVKFKEGAALSPSESALYEKNVLENAAMMWNLGEDYEDYLIKKGLKSKEDFSLIFNSEDDAE